MSDTLNTSQLTQAFLTETPSRVVFRPQSLDEAEYIAQQLQAHGFQYYQKEFAGQLALTLKGSLYLDTDKTIMVRADRIEGLLANADQFLLTRFDLPSRQVELDLRGASFALFPRSVAEGRRMAIALQEAGAAVPEDGSGSFAIAARAVYQGMIVKDGVLGFAPTREELQAAKVLTAADLGLGVAATMSPEQSALHAAFNEMAARMERMSAQLERLENEIVPKTLDKPAAPKLKKP